MLDVEYDNLRFTLVNVYGPNEDSPVFYDNVYKEINTFENATVIACGDWNMVLNQGLDTKNYVRDNNVKARTVVLNMCKSMDLSDPWRMLNQNCKRYTWRQYKPVKMARLDFFLVTGDILNNVLCVDILPAYKSDHSAILLEVKLADTSRGKGYWKFNKTLLYDEEYVKMVQDCINENIERYISHDCDLKEEQFVVNDQLFFEILKMVIRGLSIKYGSNRKKI